MHVRWLLSAAILTQWQHLVASNKILNLFYQAMHVVSYQCTAAAIKMASKVGPFFHHRFICCCPGSRWGDMEQVVTQWQHPVASGVALDMPHWAMPSVLLQGTCMAIEMAWDKGAFIFCRPLFCLP
jgi:hypothetical protein